MHSITKNYNFSNIVKIVEVVFTLLGQLNGQFTFQFYNETTENCKTIFPWCHTKS